MTAKVFSLPIVSKLHHAASKAQRMNSSEWKELYNACETLMPSFTEMLRGLENRLDYTELQICVLLKMNFILSEIRILLGISKSVLSHKRQRMNAKLFNEDGSARDFDKKIITFT